MTTSNMTTADQVKTIAERYPLPHDSAELARLRDQHEWLKSGIGQLVLAPLDLTAPNMRILDSATADGYWLLDLSNSLPASTTHVGTDIAPQLFRDDYGESFVFASQNIADTWPSEWNNSFDLVHQRLVLGNVSPEIGRQAVHNLANLVKPGGYIQLVDADISAMGKGVPEETPAQRKFAEMMGDLFSKIEGNIKPGTNLRTWLGACNLEEIEEREFDVGIGPRSKDPTMTETSTENFVRMVTHLKSAAQNVAIQSLPYTPEDCDQLSGDLSNELKTTGGTLRVHIAWGRKPVPDQ